MKRILLCLLLFITIKAFAQDSLTVYSDPIFSDEDNGNDYFVTSSTYTSSNPVVVQSMGTWLNDPSTGLQYLAVQVSAPDYIQMMSLQFNDFSLPESTDVYILNESLDYAVPIVTSALNNSANTLELPNILGNNLIVLCITTPAQASNVRLGINAIAYSTVADSSFMSNPNVPYTGYQPLPEGIGEGYGTSCSATENVYAANGGWEDQTRAVVKLAMFQATGYNGGPAWFTCTGTLMNQYGVGDDNVQPYILTARHCFDDNTDFSNVYVFFNYQSPTGSSTGPTGTGPNTSAGSNYNNGTQDGTRWYIQTPCSLVTWNAETDVALIQLNKEIPPHFNPFYAGWNNATSLVPPLQATVIGHPSGDIKKIAYSNPVVDPTPNYVCNTTLHYVDKVINWALHWITKKTVTLQTVCQLTEDPDYTVPGYAQGATQDGSSGSALFSEDGHVIGQLSWGPGSCNTAIDQFGKFSESWIAVGSGSQLSGALAPGNTGVQCIDGRQISCYSNLTLTGDYWPASYYQPENQITLSAINTIVAQGETLTQDVLPEIKSDLTAGDPYTQQSYFQPLEIHTGADFVFTAGTSISFYTGFQADYGSTFSASIAGCTQNTNTTSTCGAFREAAPGTNIGNQLNQNSTLSTKSNVEIFPNPTQGRLTISVNYETKKNVSVTVFNSVGEQVFVQNKGQISQATFQDDLSNFPDGLYIVQVKADNDITSEKIILSK